MSWLGTRRIDLDRCGSTNDEAARLAREGAPHGTIVTAREQTEGRGRDGRVWRSPPGGLYVSIVLRPALAIADLPPLTLAIGVGVCEAAEALGVTGELKWPNDVLVRTSAGYRKLAGVLVESQGQGAIAIAGIGLNVAAVPPEVATIATSLEEQVGTPIDREAVLGALVASLETWIDRYVEGGVAAIAPAWQARMAPGLQVRATLGDREVSGEPIRLGTDGALIVQDAAGTEHAVRSGDVEVLAFPDKTRAKTSV